MKKPLLASLLLAALAGAAAVAGCTSPAPGAAPSAPQAQPPKAAAAPGLPAPVPAALPPVPKTTYKVPLEDAPVRGPADALVTIVEFSDMECPFCKRAGATLAQVEAAYPGQVRVVWRHLPLPFHPQALPAALVAEAARVRGGDAAFWSVADGLLQAQPLDQPAVERASARAGVDAATLRAARPGELLERVKRDQALASSLGVNGTPTFFVNGRRLDGAQPLEAFKALVDEELAHGQALAKAGTPARDVYAKIIEGGVTAPPPPQPQAAPAQAAARVPLRADEALRGPALAPVTIVLFSDFQCPFCAKVEPTLRKLEEAYHGKVRLAWRHQPLPFHPNALPAAKAAEAARAQGKLWEMHDALFASGQTLSDATYTASARALGLDLPRFQRDLAAEGAARRIAEDQKQAVEVGASGTPTLFVNCRKLVGAQPYEAFRALVDEELAKAEARLAKGEKLDTAFYDRICLANVAAAPVAAAAAPRTDVKVALRPDDPSRGPAGAKVTVVEFSDFQCPFCSRAVPAVKELEAAHPKDVRVVWKHLPLSMHQNAMPAALAAEAARSQGKFWEMHDRLFDAQSDLSEPALRRHAETLHLDLARFDADRSAQATRQRVEADTAAAAAAGVTGTPTFVVDGELVVGSTALQAAVDRHLEKARLAARAKAPSAGQ